MEREYGGFWRRANAFIIDKFILFFLTLIVMIIGILILNLSFLTMTPTTLMSPLFLSYYGTGFVLNIFYFTYFFGTTGQTPGKKIFGLKVIQKSGEPMTLGLGFLRWVGYLISGMVFYLGFIWIGFDSKKQGWHDKIAGTLVVRTRQLQFESAGRPGHEAYSAPDEPLATPEPNYRENLKFTDY